MIWSSAGKVPLNLRGVWTGVSDSGEATVVVVAEEHTTLIDQRSGDGSRGAYHAKPGEEEAGVKRGVATFVRNLSES